MPFTPTHILAVLPIAAVCRGLLPISALVIGSMIPDLPLFSPLSPSYETTHSAPGLVSACLPLGLAGFLLFEGLMRRPLLALLPGIIRRRFASPLAPTPRAIALAAPAVVIGAATHLVWDSFTHRGRWGTRLLPGLGETALVLWGHAIPGYKLLQYGSTLVGLPILAILLARWLGRRGPVPPGGGPALPASVRVAASLVAVAIPACVVLLVWRRADESPYERLGKMIRLSGLALLVATLAYCLAFHAVEWSRRRAE